MYSTAWFQYKKLYEAKDFENAVSLFKSIALWLVLIHNLGGNQCC